jgi:hypothetical protein
MMCGAFPFSGQTDKDLYKKIRESTSLVWPDKTTASKEA